MNKYLKNNNKTLKMKLKLKKKLDKFLINLIIMWVC